MKIAFIGSGNMASALARGFISSKCVDEKSISITDKNPDCLKKWENQGVFCTTDNVAAVTASDIVICAVKPNVLPPVLNEIRLSLSDKIVVSIAAGITVETIEAIVGADKKIIRAMPNTPAQVGCGMTVLSPNGKVSSEELETVETLFAGAGNVVVLDEKYINVATALHGSSPAYVYMLIEAMANSGVKHGIPKAIALELSAKAVEGAAKMVLETKTHPAILKDAVCSPGGTTIAAVCELEKSGFSTALDNAVDACIRKADEMSNK